MALKNNLLILHLLIYKKSADANSEIKKNNKETKKSTYEQ